MTGSVIEPFRFGARRQEATDAVREDSDPEDPNGHPVIGR
jgi:hypothetical protein